MSMFPQPGPILFNIENEIQERMVVKVLDGFAENQIEDMWKATQKYFITRGIHIYNKNYKKYKGGAQAALQHYKMKLKKEMEASGEARLAPFADVDQLNLLVPTEYGLMQIVTNYFLYKNKKKNLYYEWALDPPKPHDTPAFNFSQGESIMYRKDREKKDMKKDIAKYNEKFRIDSRAGLIEASLNITRQCMASCGKKPTQKDGIKCYICGEYIQNESGVDAAGSQCEHVVPVTALAALCGLSGEDYDKTIESYLKDKGKDYGGEKCYISPDGEWVIPKKTYALWRKNLLGDGRETHPAADHGGGKEDTGVMYRWSHPGCNMIKKDHAFLALDWTPAATDEEWKELKEKGFPVLDEEEYCDEQGIKYVLERLVDIVKGGGGSHSKAWRNKFLPGALGPYSAPKEEAWVTDRLNKMKDNTMKWAKQVICSQNINGVFSPQYKAFKSGVQAAFGAERDVEQSDWPSFRTALCDLSMNILDFRVEEKIIAHYEKFSPGGALDKDKILEDWRKPEWSDLVGLGGGGRTMAVRPGEIQSEHGPNRGVKNQQLGPKNRDQRRTTQSDRQKQQRAAVRERAREVPEVRKLNYEFKLAVYFDVLDSTTPEEDRVCLARNRAREYIENSYNYIDRDEVDSWVNGGAGWYYKDLIKELNEKLTQQKIEMRSQGIGSQGRTKKKKKKKKPRIPVKTKGKRGAIGKMTRAKPLQSKKPLKSKKPGKTKKPSKTKKPGRKPLKSKKPGRKPGKTKMRRWY